MLDLNSCDAACFGCIKSYKKKHSLIQGQKFEVQCSGIPKEYLSPELLASISSNERETAKSMLDPVAWAAQNLDWHCLDPDGEIWKRKNPNEYFKWMKEHPGESILGKSRYHRPYQKIILECTSKRKVLRVGRQAGKSEAIVIAALFNAFTKPGVPESEGFDIVLIAPYQTQVDLLFKRMLQLINGSEITANSLKRDVKAPIYTIELHNGSQLKGFTAGSKSGGHADAVRGQHANMLIFDEQDYLNTADIESALSIITNYPDATVIASSTPTGRRERFFNLCSSKLWKEFHYPSQVNPMWTDEQDKMFKEQLTAAAYNHEILGIFGSQEEGVFQSLFIEAAKKPYEYEDLSFNPAWTYTIGVDWNDVKIGTTIRVIGFDPSKNRFMVVGKYNVSKEGWNQLAACQKIVELNRLWNPKFIYVDKGYGHMAYEVIKKHGYDSLADPTKGPGHPDAKLRDIVKQYDFGSTIEVKDLFTKQPIDKDAKPFLVETTVRRFESGDLIFSDQDEILEKQLHGYIVDRTTSAGRPVYRPIDKTTGDHDLDALMLAIVAFTLELTPVGKATYDSHIAFGGSFGEKNLAETFVGDTVISSLPQKTDDIKSRYKPEMNRTNTLENKSLLHKNDLPASHINKDTSVPLWTWPGFSRDEAKPHSRTLSEAESDARKRQGLTSRHIKRPNRKSF